MVPPPSRPAFRRVQGLCGECDQATLWPLVDPEAEDEGTIVDVGELGAAGECEREQ